MHQYGKKRLRKNCDEEETKEDEEEERVESIGTVVYFYAEVTRLSVFKMLKCLNEATQKAACDA